MKERVKRVGKLFEEKVLQKNNECPRLKKPTRHPMKNRRYNVGLSRDPQPDLYQIRCALAYNKASDMPAQGGA